MGGMGSGCWDRWDKKGTVEGRRAIDVRRWQREGSLAPGRCFRWQWAYAGGESFTISVRTESEWSLRLIYRIRSWGEDDWHDVDYSIGLERTPCHFGGERVWFRCPGHGCGRRVARLHQVGRYFLCRHCGNLAYESQREDPPSRAMSKALKIRKKLGASANLLEASPAKPKGMHWRTYERLCNQGVALEQKAWKLMSEMLG